jgi:hypothetical protein
VEVYEIIQQEYATLNGEALILLYPFSVSVWLPIKVL